MSTPRSILAALLCAFVAGALAPDAAHAGKTKRLYFQITDVEARKGVADQVPAWVRGQLGTELAKRKGILTELPENAPDPDSEPKKFKRYLKKKRIRAFKVNVEITSYSQEIQELPEPRSGHYVTVSVALRMFGETIPDRVMAFSGDGSATIKLEVGKRVRDRDTKVANHDAIELAVAEAVTESMVKLGRRPRGKRKK